jgi:hypothetical protein
VPYNVTGNVLTVGFPSECRFQKGALEDAHNVAFVERVFSELLNTPLIVKYVIVDNYSPQEETEDVKEVLDTFGGEVVNRWHDE